MYVCMYVQGSLGQENNLFYKLNTKTLPKSSHSLKGPKIT